MARAVVVRLGGKEYDFRLDINALADLEQQLGMGFAALFAGDRIGFATIRAVMWSGLRRSSPALTLEHVGDIIQNEMERNDDALTYLTESIDRALTAAGLSATKSRNGGSEGKASSTSETSASNSGSETQSPGPTESST